MIDLIVAIARHRAVFVMDKMDTGPEAGGSITFSFINTTCLDIVVIDRNHESMFIERAMPGTNMDEPGLMIKMTRNHPTRSSMNAVPTLIGDLANQHGGPNSVQASALSVYATSLRGGNGSGTICRRYFVPLKDIENNTNLFETQTGLVISVNQGWQNVCHPESEEFRSKNQNTSFFDNQPVGRLFEIVDNERQHKERFVFVGREVIRVQNTVDRERDNGLYVTEVRAMGGKRSTSNTTRYSFEEGYKKFGLFLTREEALTSGDPGLLQLRENEELKRQLEVNKHNMALIEQQHAAEVLGRKVELEKNSHILKEAQMVMAAKEASDLHHTAHAVNANRRITENMKDEAERDRIRRDAAHASYSSSLKASSDSFKYLPSIITGTVAVCAGLIYFFKK